MRPRDLDASARRDVLATCRRHNVELAGIDLWIPAAHFDDAALAGRAIEALMTTLVLAEDLGRVLLSTSLPDGDAAQHVTPHIIAEADRRGILIADHAVQRHHTSRAAGIDPAAQLSVGRTPAQAVIDAGRSCASARLCDLTTTGDRAPLGQRAGQVDVVEYRAALAAVEYEHPIIIDTRQWSDVWNGVESTISAWRAAAPVL
jgi:sugar phosphate isomerase/epimerase